MLIDSLTFTLEKSGCLDAFWGKLDEGHDGTLGVASSARPFLVAARFAHKPQPTHLPASIVTRCCFISFRLSLRIMNHYTGRGPRGQHR